MKWASVWLLGLGLSGCGTPATPGVVEQTPATTGEAPPKPVQEPKSQEVSKPEPEPEPEPAPTVPSTLGEPGQPVPIVDGVLPPLPEPSLPVVVTLDILRVGDATAALERGALPDAKSPPTAIVDALLASPDPVVWVVDAGVPAATLRTLIGVLPPERARFLVMQTPKGEQGAVALSSTSAADAPHVRIASDGFHLAETGGATEHRLGPDEAGETFDYVELRNKAKSFRTRNPDVAGIRVDTETDVTVEVLARAISVLRGPKCAVEPRRCWLPEVAFGDGLATSRSAPKPKTEIDLPKQGDASHAPGRVELSKAKVGEGVDASKVDAVLKRRAGFARMCYFAALADSPGLAGTMDLRLTLGDDGKVIEVGVPKSTLGDDAVEACLTKGLEGLRFSAPAKAPVAVDVSLTFTVQ